MSKGQKIIFLVLFLPFIVMYVAFGSLIFILDLVMTFLNKD